MLHVFHGARHKLIAARDGWRPTILILVLKTRDWEPLLASFLPTAEASTKG